jgi:hypothetical protein
MTSGDLVDGEIGKAIEFDGSNDKISIPNLPVFEYHAIITHYWSDQSQTGQDNYIQSPSFLSWDRAGEANSYDYRFGPFHDDRLVARWNQGGDNSIVLYSNSTISHQTWLSAAGVQYSDKFSIYMEGSIDKEDTGYTACLTGDPPVGEIGTLYTNQDTDFFDGKISNLQYFSTSVSAAWIKADYHAQTDNLITWGVEEEAVFITAAPIKSTTQITAEVASRIEIVAAPIKSNTQITARVRMFWPHKINGLASGNIASFYRQAVNIEDVDKINDV